MRRVKSSDGSLRTDHLHPIGGVHLHIQRSVRPLVDAHKYPLSAGHGHGTLRPIEIAKGRIHLYRPAPDANRTDPEHIVYAP